MSKARTICKRRLLGCVGTALGVALLMAGSSGARAQSNAPADTTKLVTGASSSGVAQLPLYVAIDQGFFKKAGIDVERQDMNGGTPAVMAAYASGAINILNLSGPELVQYTGAKVVSGKAFAEMGDLNYDMLTAKSITKIEDLKGKTLGISSANGADYVFLVATMQHYGLTPSDVTFITTGNPVNRLAALSSGAVQGVAAGNYSRDVSTKAGNILLKSNDNPVQFPTQLFIANADFIKNHGPLLKKFVAALEDTTAWIRANQATAANVCAKTIGGTVADCASAITLSFDPTVSSKYTWSSKFGINMEGMKNALAVMATLDPSTKNITLDDITDTSIAGTAP